jgi:hypothetical protein
VMLLEGKEVMATTVGCEEGKSEFTF